MPIKKVRASSKNKSPHKKVHYTPQFTPKTGLTLLIRRTIMVLIPVFALLAVFGVFQSAFNPSPSLDTTADADTAHSLFYSFDKTAKTAEFQGEVVSIPDSLTNTLASAKTNNAVLGDSTGGEKWIEVDLTKQKLIAHDGDQIFLESLVSTGIPGKATPTGEFRIWYKIESTKMEGGEGKEHYYLPNVPWVMFFENDQVPGYKGYSLHGAYWHHNWGHTMSHGCVNLPIDVSQKLYEWTTPVASDGKRLVRATDDNPGTRIVIHY